MEIRLSHKEIQEIIKTHVVKVIPELERQELDIHNLHYDTEDWLISRRQVNSKA